MHLICPECQASFALPDGMLGPRGRRVRCSACTHIWFQEPPPGETPAPEPVFEPVPLPEPEQEQPVSFRSSLTEQMDVDPIPDSLRPDENAGEEEQGRRLLAGWPVKFAAALLATILTGVVVMGIGYATGWADKPFLQPFYNGLGLVHAAPANSLKLSGLKALGATDAQGHDVTRVTGLIVNAANMAQRIPLIALSSVSHAGQEGDMVTIRTEKETVAPGEKADFSADLPGRPVPGSSVKLQFTTD